MTHSRRTIVRGAAWTVPVVAVATSAPAFAVSALVCSPTAECKLPGAGQNTKDYTIRTNCASVGGTITSVEVRNKFEEWVPAAPNADGTWTAAGFNDSRRDRLVRITDSSGQSTSSIISFPPC